VSDVGSVELWRGKAAKKKIETLVWCSEKTSEKRSEEREREKFLHDPKRTQFTL
jgi:hypothetical protein